MSPNPATLAPTLLKVKVEEKTPQRQPEDLSPEEWDEIIEAVAPSKEPNEALRRARELQKILIPD